VQKETSHIRRRTNVGNDTLDIFNVRSYSYKKKKIGGQTMRKKKLLLQEKVNL